VVTPWPVQDNHKKPLKKTIKPGVRHTAPRDLHNTQSERGKNIECFEKKPSVYYFTPLHLKINKDKLATDRPKIQSFYSFCIECLRLKT
jgi:hypothetical protein